MRCILCGGKLVTQFNDEDVPLRACDDDSCALYHEWMTDGAWQALVAHAPPPKKRAVLQEIALKNIRFLASRNKVYTEKRRLEIILAIARRALGARRKKRVRR